MQLFVLAPFAVSLPGRTCALCPAELPPSRPAAELHLLIGRTAPDGGAGRSWGAALCVDCLEGRVRPALEGLGLRFESRGWTF